MDVEKRHNNTFESIRKTMPDGREFWLARDLQPILEYKSWDKFKNVISKAMTACKESGQPLDYHFSQLGKMIALGKGGLREISHLKSQISNLRSLF